MKLTRSARRALSKMPSLIVAKMKASIVSPTLRPGIDYSLLRETSVRAAVVAQFQEQEGLTVDSHPGSATYAALWQLNKPTEEQFVLSMLAAAENTGTIYQLGRGGFGWFEQELSDASDCSGFIAHCLGLSRKPNPAFPRWFSTDSIWADARGEDGLFRVVEPDTPNSIVVYPDYRARGKQRQGHVGFVVKDGYGYDCSSSMYRRHGDAIKHRDLNFFRKKAKTVWCRPVWWE